MNETYLAHHGVLGQKWGVRRYQNKDGSLTPEGRRHRGYSEKTGGSDLKKVGSKVKKVAGDAYKTHKQNKVKKEKDLEIAKEKARKEAIERQAKKAIAEEEKLKQYLRENPQHIYKNRDKFF